MADSDELTALGTENTRLIALLESQGEASHRPASQVVRELMREFVERQRQARKYDAFLRGKVDTARAQIASSQVASSADVEARFAARRAALRAKTGAADA